MRRSAVNYLGSISISILSTGVLTESWLRAVYVKPGSYQIESIEDALLGDALANIIFAPFLVRVCRVSVLASCAGEVYPKS